VRTTLKGPSREEPIKPWALFIDDVFVKAVTLTDAQNNLNGPYNTERDRLTAYARRQAYILSVQRKATVMFTNTVHFLVFFPDGRRAGIGPGKRGKIIEAYQRNIKTTQTCTKS